MSISTCLFNSGIIHSLKQREKEVELKYYWDNVPSPGCVKKFDVEPLNLVTFPRPRHSLPKIWCSLPFETTGQPFISSILAQGVRKLWVADCGPAYISFCLPYSSCWDLFKGCGVWVWEGHHNPQIWQNRDIPCQLSRYCMGNGIKAGRI